MRVRRIDLRVQVGNAWGEQRIMRCRENRWTELTQKIG
jgi:hypothetical protein